MTEHLRTQQSNAFAVELEARPEPTLGAALRKFAFTQLPGRFHQFLQLGAPAAVQLAALGWYRSAGWAGVLSAFGLWALSEQSIRRAEEPEPLVPVTPGRIRFLRVTRAVTGGLAGLGAAALLSEALIRVLHVVFRCPGCAG